MSDYTAFDLVMQVAEEQAIPELPYNYVVLESGAVLEVTGVSMETYNAVIRKFENKEPPIPVVELKSKGGRMEPNPNDPKYIKDHKIWEGKQSSSLFLAVCAFGVRLVSVPAGVAGPDDDQTIDELRLSGMLESDTDKGHLVAWLQHRALSVDARKAAGEINAILFAAGRVMGVTIPDVQDAAKRP